MQVEYQADKYCHLNFANIEKQNICLTFARNNRIVCTHKKDGGGGEMRTIAGKTIAMRPSLIRHTNNCVYSILDFYTHSQCQKWSGVGAADAGVDGDDDGMFMLIARGSFAGKDRHTTVGIKLILN